MYAASLREKFNQDILKILWAFVRNRISGLLISSKGVHTADLYVVPTFDSSAYAVMLVCTYVSV